MDSGGGAAKGGAVSRNRMEVWGGDKVFSLVSDPAGVRQEAKHTQNMFCESGWVNSRTPTAEPNALWDSSSGDDSNYDDSERLGSASDVGVSAKLSESDSEDDRSSMIGCSGPNSSESCNVC